MYSSGSIHPWKWTGEGWSVDKKVCRLFTQHSNLLQFTRIIPTWQTPLVLDFQYMDRGKAVAMPQNVCIVSRC